MSESDQLLHLLGLGIRTDRCVCVCVCARVCANMCCLAHASRASAMPTHSCSLRYRYGFVEHQPQSSQQAHLNGSAPATPRSTQAGAAEPGASSPWHTPSPSTSSRLAGLTGPSNAGESAREAKANRNRLRKWLHMLGPQVGCPWLSPSGARSPWSSVP